MSIGTVPIRPRRAIPTPRFPSRYKSGGHPIRIFKSKQNRLPRAAASPYFHKSICAGSVAPHLRRGRYTPARMILSRLSSCLSRLSAGKQALITFFPRQGRKRRAGPQGTAHREGNAYGRIGLKLAKPAARGGCRTAKHRWLRVRRSSPFAGPEPANPAARAGFPRRRELTASGSTPPTHPRAEAGETRYAGRASAPQGADSIGEYASNTSPRRSR